MKITQDRATQVVERLYHEFIANGIHVEELWKQLNIELFEVTNTYDGYVIALHFHSYNKPEQRIGTTHVRVGGSEGVSFREAAKELAAWLRLIQNTKEVGDDT